jgi:acyl-CoA thioester hydrolase
MSENFKFNIRIYYEDTDFSGFVYHGSYVKFFERARTEWLRHLGIHHSELAKQGLAFAVSRMEIDFKKSTHIDDLLEISTKIIKLSAARIILEQKITCKEQEVALAKVTIAVINSKGRSTRLPKEWEKLFSSAN